MTFITLPIYLDQDPTGCILPLIDFAEDGEFQGFGTPPTTSQDLQAHISGDSNDLIDAKLSVGLFGMGGIDRSGEWTTRSFEWRREGLTSSSGTGVGYGITWGFGYRLHLQSQSKEFEGTVTPTLIAFKTRLKGLQTSFALESFGLQDFGLYGALPTPDTYDSNTFAVILRAMNASVDAAITANSFKPVPLGIVFGGDFAKHAVLKACSVRLAASMMRNYQPKNKAIELAQKNGLLPKEVARVYDLWLTNAAGLASDWLGEEKQRDLEIIVDGAPLPAVPINGAHNTLEAERIIVRSQVMDIETSAKLGYHSATVENNHANRNFVYEVFRRSGPLDWEIKNGIGYLKSKVSGLIRIRCLNQNIETHLQGSILGITADAVVNKKRADFSFYGYGYSDAIDHQQLTNVDADAFGSAVYLANVGASFKLLQDKNNHILSYLPCNIALQCGLDQKSQGFPGARAIVCSLQCLADNDDVSSARKKLEDIGLEASAADGIYAAFSSAKARDYLQKSEVP